MGDDEEATVRTVTEYRELITSLIQENNGRVVDAKGANTTCQHTTNRMQRIKK